MRSVHGMRRTCRRRGKCGGAPPFARASTPRKRRRAHDLAARHHRRCGDWRVARIDERGVADVDADARTRLDDGGWVFPECGCRHRRGQRVAAERDARIDRAACCSWRRWRCTSRYLTISQREGGTTVRPSVYPSMGHRQRLIQHIPLICGGHALLELPRSGGHRRRH